MTTLEAWKDFSITVMEENIKILRELNLKNQNDLMIEQGKALKKHLDSFVEYLERVKKSE